MASISFHLSLSLFLSLAVDGRWSLLLSPCLSFSRYRVGGWAMVSLYIAVGLGGWVVVYLFFWGDRLLGGGFYLVLFLSLSPSLSLFGWFGGSLCPHLLVSSYH